MKKVHHLVQGSPEWKAHRATPGMINGSEIAAIMGLDPHTSRSELLRMKATGSEKEFSDFVQKRVLDKGHEYEALARPIAEDIIGDDLSALVITNTIDGVLFSVSFDGITQGHDITSEHKSLNQALAAALDAGTLPEQYPPQCEAGLMVAEAKRCLFMASRDGDLSTMRHFWYEPNPEFRARMIAACKQFLIDWANYQHTEVAERPAPAVTIELPALFVHAKGEITDSNMKAYGEALALRLAEVRAIQLVTDQDFSNAKQSAAMLREQCAKMKLTKEAMLSQTVTIGEAARMMDAWSEDMRVTALKLEKDVEREDVAKKAAIVTAARIAYVEHINALNRRIGGVWMPNVTPDFAGAIRGKRNYGSMTDAVDAMLANAKVDADMLADRIELNRDSLLIGTENDTGHLFPDFAQVCTKLREDFAALHAMRIQQEAVRKEDERKAAEAREAAAVAAAVEAERKAGEARAAEAARIAAADEAERIRKEEAAKPVKQDVPPVLDPAKPAGDVIPPQAVALAPEEKRAVLIESGDDVRDFLKTQTLTDKEHSWLRARLMAFEQFKAARALKAAA